MKRGCMCADVGDQACPVHALERRLNDTPVGQALFPNLEVGPVLKTMRWLAALLGEPKAAKLTYKSIRRGHATHLAKTGHSVVQILNWGDWKGQAMLNYIDMAEVDPTAVLEEAFEHDEE